MKNQCEYPVPDSFWVFASAVSISFVSILSILMPSYAQSARDAELPQERQIHNTFSRDQKNGSLIDATNPMDLINRLREATAMDNATPPSDAIDDALRALEMEESTNPLEKESPLE